MYAYSLILIVTYREILKHIQNGDAQYLHGTISILLFVIP